MKNTTLILMSRKQDETFNMDTGLYTTPGWTLSEKKLSNLVGNKVALTTRSNERSYLGGTIVGFVPAKRTSNLRCSFFCSNGGIGRRNGLKIRCP